MNFNFFLVTYFLYANIKAQSKSEFIRVIYFPCTTVLISVIDKNYLFLITSSPVIILCLTEEKLKYRKTGCNEELKVKL